MLTHDLRDQALKQRALTPSATYFVMEVIGIVASGAHIQGVWKKSLPKKSSIKSAVFGAPVSFLHELIARLGEISGEGFIQIGSL